MSSPTATTSKEIPITRVYSGAEHNDGVNIEKFHMDSPSELEYGTQSLQSSSSTSSDFKTLNIHVARALTSIDEPNTEAKTPRVNELDKFKRRLIRAIARLMLEEKKPEDEIWEELKKETSCDCKLLWTRMRSLTIKKLKRLFAAGDRNDNITKIARLSVTDWLLFDLVLAHEDVNVIEQDTEGSNKNDPTILEDLFNLVVKYKTEYLAGDKLTLAWYDLTQEYNSRGRTCSPMLLQRRWYQIKEQARSKFYNFWFEYRGFLKKLERADKYKPTALQMAIVKRFMFIVTMPFQSWEQLIKDKRVSLPSDFERLQLSKNKISTAENESDIELLESQVETIDLGLESDEDSRESNNSACANSNKDSDNIDPSVTDSNDGKPNLAIVKTESLCHLGGEDEVSALESMHIPLESNLGQAINEQNKEIRACDETNMLRHKIQEPMDENQTIIDINHSDVEGEKESNICELADNTVSTDVAVEQNDSEIVMPKITSVTSAAQIPEIPVIYEIPDEINDKLERVADQITRNKLNTLKLSEINKDKQDILNADTEKPEDMEEIDMYKKDKLDPNFYNEEVSNDLHLVDGIELVDDGIEFIDEEGQMTGKKMEINIEGDKNECSKIDDENSPKIDLKLLLNPVVYTKKLEHMNVFRSIDYVTVKDARVIENAVTESKPIDKNAVKTDISPELIKNILGYEDSKRNPENNHDMIKSTSWLFHKPRNISYNPIQLCKNPDFNTRLKRLTVGFFSSQRNRQLLKQCKPLTIDVHKAFEERLVNNSLLIKGSYISEAKRTELIKTVEKTVLPSELPGQSLICNVQDNTQSTSILSVSTTNQVSKYNRPEVYAIERNKVINLPDLDQIRRTNERLLIAEVTPLQPSDVTNRPPVSIIYDDKLFEHNSQPALLFDEEDIVNNANKITNSIITPALNGDLCSSTNNDIPEVIRKTSTANNKCSSDVNSTALTYQKLLKSLNNIKRSLKPNNKVRTVSVTWNHRQVTSMENDKKDDRLLAADTVERIMSVCQGLNLPLSKKNQTKLNKRKYKAKLALLKNANQNQSSQGIQITNVKSILSIEGQQQQKQATVQSETVAKDENEKVVTIDQKQKQKKRFMVNSKKIAFCCWAREKLEFWNQNIKRVKSSHLCPQSKCVCCCNIEFCEILKQRNQNRLGRSISYCNLVSDDESDSNSDKLNKLQKPTQISQRTQNEDKELCEMLKVSIGINTDFDKDFEESYANSLKNLNLNNSSEVIDEPRSLDNKDSYSHGTQTVTYKKIDPASLLNSIIDSVTTKTKGNHNSPIITNVQSVKSSPIPIQPSKSGMEKSEEPKKNPRKCITKIFPAPDRTNRPLRTVPPDRKKQDSKKSELPNQDFEITESIPSGNDKNKNRTVVLNKPKSNITQSPICLGKNKILLCSLKPLNKTSMIDVTHLVEDLKQQIKPYQNMPLLIPKGVHFVLLPNQELVLSIDPGVELEPSQIANLPTIIASVQQKLFSLGVINKLPYVNTNVSKGDEIIQLSDDETDVSNTNKSQDISNLEINKDIRNVSVLNLNDIEMDITANKIRKSDASSITHTTCNSMNQLVDKNNIATTNNEVIKETGQNSTSEGDKQYDTIQYVPNIYSNIHVPLDLRKKKDNVDSSKKTILSDLMEMSGISLEDTTITNTDNPLRQQTSLPELPLLQAPNNILHTNNEVVRTNLLLNNPFVQAALTKCPDLCIVYSFDDLKYAHENDGQFYKMDITTGIIVPINVSIKKKRNRPKHQKKTDSPKSVIDLTEEDKSETQTPEIEEEIAPSSAEGESQTHDLEKEISLSNAEDNIETPDIEEENPVCNVKPIKLIKTIHSSTLKHNFNTLRMQTNLNDSSPNSHGKKFLKIIKHKRKHIDEIIDLNFDDKIEDSVEKLNKLKNCDKVNRADNSESDDEPLAHKAKRIKHTPVRKSQKNISIEGPEENIQEDMPPNQLESYINETTSYNIIENLQEDFDSSQDEPVILECNDESSDEDCCILGV